MTGMDDLIGFLRAELDEDEQVALAASPGPWQPNAEHDEILAADNITVADGFALSGNQLRATVDQIALWDPVRALAEIDAKRRILNEYEQARDYYDQHREAPAGEVHGLFNAVQLLALPYADRPGYQQQWHPA